MFSPFKSNSLWSRPWRVNHSTLNIPLPEAWSHHIKSGILNVISLARVALVAASARAAQSRKAHTRLRAELAEARREISQLQEELRLKDLRMSRVRPRRRPHYRAVERMAILEAESCAWLVEKGDRATLSAATSDGRGVDEARR